MGCLQGEMLLNLLWDATPALGTSWLRADPKVHESPQAQCPPGIASSLGFLGSGGGPRDLFLSGLKMRAGHRSGWAPDVPSVSAWAIPEHLGQAVEGVRRNPCLGQQRRSGWDRTAEPWLEKL